jgi:hypothetical protein
MLLAADDVRDAQIGVVGAVRQMIGRHAVAAEEGEIFNISVGFGLIAIHGIVEFHVADAVVRHAEAQGERFAGRGAADHSLRATARAYRH